MNIFIKAQELCRILNQISNLPQEQQHNLINYCKKYDSTYQNNLNNLYNKSKEELK